MALGIIVFVWLRSHSHRTPCQAEDLAYDIDRQNEDEAFGEADRFLNALDPYASMGGHHQTGPEAFSEAIGFHAE